MRRRPAGLAALLALAALLLAGPALGGTAAATPAPSPAAIGSTAAAPQAAGESAVQRFSACLDSARSGQLLLLIDESGSLRASDPGNARVTAARYLLSRLADLSTRSGIRLDTAVAGFADRYTPPPGWQSLDGSTLPGLTAQVDAFADRNDGVATDYWTAMEQARRTLAAQAPPAPAQRCQALFWFTDGELDLTARPGAVDPISGAPLDSEQAATRAEAGERDALCRPETGLADQLRASGVITFGIGLDTAARPGAFDLMRSIATGSSGSMRCGRPTDRPPGEFRLASGIDDLVFAFDGLIPPEPIGDQDRPVCPGGPCAAGRHTFVLDPSISRVQILGTVTPAGPDAVLLPPDGGPPIPLQPRTVAGGTQVRGPATAGFTWLTDQTVSVDLTPSARGAGWSGEWALVFVDPRGGGGTSRANVHVTSDLTPVWADRPPVLHSGDVLPGATFGLADGRGTPVPPSSVRGDLSLDVALLATGRPQQTVAAGLDKARIGTPTGLDLRGVPPGMVTLRLTLRQRTAPAVRPGGGTVPGTSLPPRSMELPLRIAGPVGYPDLDPAVDFGSGERTTELTGTLGATGPGCVWLPPQPPVLDSAPRDAGGVTVTSAADDPGSCLDLAPGQRSGLSLTLRTDHPGNGAVSGSVLVRVAPRGEPGPVRDVPVTVTADLLLPVNEGVFWPVFVSVLLLGLLIPLLLLWLFKYLTGRIPEGQVAAVAVPVTVRDGWVTGRDGAAFGLDPGDFRTMSYLDPGRRRMRVLDVELTARTGFSPFGTSGVRAGTPGGRYLSAAPGRSGTSGDDARLPLAVHNRWFVRHDPLGSPDEAEVVVLLGLVPPAPPGALDRIAEEIRRDLPGLLQRLRPDTGSAPGGSGPSDPPRPPGPSDPFGPPGPPPGPPGGRTARAPFDFRT